MYIASMIIRVNPQKAQQIADELEELDNVTTYGVHKEENIVLVAEALEVKELENLSRYILETYDDVIGVFPTYLTYDEETENV